MNECNTCEDCQNKFKSLESQLAEAISKLGVERDAWGKRECELMSERDNLKAELANERNELKFHDLAMRKLEEERASLRAECERLKNLLEMSELTRKADVKQCERYREALKLIGSHNKGAPPYLSNYENGVRDGESNMAEIAIAAIRGRKP
jgi:chromosome segregation ATPase